MWTTISNFLVIFLIVIGTYWYLYFRYCFKYWQNRGVPTLPPIFPAGNITKPMLIQENVFVCLKNIYQQLKDQGHKYGGLYFFNGPIFMPISPEIIKPILTTYFEHFSEHGTYCDEKNLPLTCHLFSIPFNKWRPLRTKLSPVFTSGKLKMMYADIFMKNTLDVVAILNEKIQNKNGIEINTKLILQRYTANIITNSAFGMEAGSLRDDNSIVLKVIQSCFENVTWGFIKTVLTEGLQNPGNLAKAIHEKDDVEKFFRTLVKDTIEFREKNGLVRNDFMSLMMEIRDKEGLEFNEMVAQSFLFFVAGFETSSSTLSFCLHELAHNADIQERLRNEIRQNLGGNIARFDYETLMKLPYLDRVLKETLRLYPALGMLNRICTKEYTIPGTDVTITKGTPVIISTLGLQQDPEYFPDPLKFDPDRFDESHNTIIPYTYLPFGEGPRICIGLAALITKFRIFPSEKTPKVIEFDRIPTALLLCVKDGIYIRLDAI